MPFEGDHPKPYYDPPHVATDCFGHTQGVKITDRPTEKDCLIFLSNDTMAAEAEVDRDVKIKISNDTRAAFISFVFNVGGGTFRRSTMLKKLNAGDIIGACDQLNRWVYDTKGEKLPGLVKRRAGERQLCLDGIGE